MKKQTKKTNKKAMTTKTATKQIAPTAITAKQGDVAKRARIAAKMRTVKDGNGRNWKMPTEASVKAAAEDHAVNPGKLAKGGNLIGTCTCCGRQFQSHTSDGPTCPECWESAGYANDHADNGHPTKLAECPTCLGLECLHEEKETPEQARQRLMGAALCDQYLMDEFGRPNRKAAKKTAKAPATKAEPEPDTVHLGGGLMASIAAPAPAIEASAAPVTEAAPKAAKPDKYEREERITRSFARIAAGEKIFRKWEADEPRVCLCDAAITSRISLERGTRLCGACYSAYAKRSKAAKAAAKA